jgi:hypothetical protein
MDLKEVELEEVNWVTVGPVRWCCECGNEYSGFVKCGEFLE